MSPQEVKKIKNPYYNIFFSKNILTKLKQYAIMKSLTLRRAYIIIVNWWAEMEQQWLEPKLVASRLQKLTALNTVKSFTHKSVAKVVETVTPVALPLTLHSHASLVPRVVASLAVALQRNLSKQTAVN